MEALVCEMCGSNDIVKKDGLYVCQHCGTKYTVEEAKKLMSTVKIDRTEETDNLIVLARRARESGDYKNAEMYYGQILQNNPNNWEAAFFHVYYGIKPFADTTETCERLVQLANVYDVALKLILDLDSEEKQNEALDIIIDYSKKIIDRVSDSAFDKYKQFPSTPNGRNNGYVATIIFAGANYLTLAGALKKYYSNDIERLLRVQKTHVDFDIKYGFLFANNSAESQINELAEEIKKNDPDYTVPRIQFNSTNSTQSTQVGKQGGCYVATAVYGSYDCPEVWTLRRYRDYSLAKTWHGRTFIRLYYVISPIVVRLFGKTEWFHDIWKPKLDNIVKNLNEKGFIDTPYQDRKW